MLKYLNAIATGLSLFLVLWITILSLGSGLETVEANSPTQTQSSDEDEITPVVETKTLTPESLAQLPTALFTEVPEPTATLNPTVTIVSTPLPSPTPTLLPTQLPPERWKEWPVMPLAVSETLRQAYQNAVDKGTIDPHAFSVLGDCQGEAYAFLGIFDSDPAAVASMSADSQALVKQFTGSFNRYNPAAKSGSSAGSLLYPPWNDNKEGKCVTGETPVDCELRTHRPSIVFIQLGTHFETPTRNYAYMSTIIEKVKKTGAVAVIVTKADNLELDEFVNQNIADLAVQYDLPLWNFWSSVQVLPSKGLQPDGMHLTEDGNVIHKVDALRVLGFVWQAVR
jgi:hypothetical protein